jgi:hypothetical protein
VINNSADNLLKTASDGRINFDRPEPWAKNMRCHGLHRNMGTILHPEVKLEIIML